MCPPVSPDLCPCPEQVGFGEHVPPCPLALTAVTVMTDALGGTGVPWAGSQRVNGPVSLVRAELAPGVCWGVKGEQLWGLCWRPWRWLGRVGDVSGCHDVPHQGRGIPDSLSPAQADLWAALGGFTAKRLSRNENKAETSPERLSRVSESGEPRCSWGGTGPRGAHGCCRCHMFGASPPPLGQRRHPTQVPGVPSTCHRVPCRRVWGERAGARP